jgi:PAS domain S-box-containing protein
MDGSDSRFHERWWAKHFFYVGLVLGVVYWWLESALHVYIFHEGTLIQQVVSPDAHEIWMRLIVEGLLVGFSFYGQTIINARRRVERALIRREKEATDILEHNPAAIMLIDAETRCISWVNSNAVRVTGSSKEQLVGRVCHDHLCPSQRGSCPVLDWGRTLDRSERALRAMDGRKVPILKSVTRVTYKDRDHLLEAFFDITKQKEMQRAIKAAHAELQQIFQTASVGMRLIDSDYNILKVNETFARLASYPAQRAVGRKCYEVFSGAKCHTEECPLKRILTGRDTGQYEVVKKRSDGTEIPCILRSTPFSSPDGETIGIVESFQDITDLKAIQEELRSERDKLHRILFHQLEGVGIVNTEWDMEYRNEAFASMLKGATGRKCYQVYRQRKSPCSHCYMQNAIATGTIQRCEFDASDGKSYEHTYTPFVDTDNRLKAVVSVRDITERKASTLAAVSSDRLAALGELAAGVAHEINNPVNGIINYAQIFVNKFQKEDLIRDISGRIVKEGDRIARIVESLLSFARQEAEERSVVALEEILDDSLTLTAAQLRKDGISIEVDVSPGLPSIEVHTQKIQQVFVNLISNARYALNKRSESRDDAKALRISAEPHTLEGKALVRIQFHDSGIGIPAKIIDKIMNPFFSTKPKGMGTGLGLSISHGIINDHGGILAIESQEDLYTRVTIDLPAAVLAEEGRLAS